MPTFDIVSQVDMQEVPNAVDQVLEEKLVKRKVSLKALEHGKIEEASKGAVRPLDQGIQRFERRELVYSGRLDPRELE